VLLSTSYLVNQLATLSRLVFSFFLVMVLLRTKSSLSKLHPPSRYCLVEMPRGSILTLPRSSDCARKLQSLYSEFMQCLEHNSHLLFRISFELRMSRP
jgi:hypothetical protein